MCRMESQPYVQCCKHCGTKLIDQEERRLYRLEQMRNINRERYQTQQEVRDSKKLYFIQKRLQAGYKLRPATVEWYTSKGFTIPEGTVA